MYRLTAMRAPTALLLAGLALAAPGCGGDDGSRTADRTVVATTPQVADIARNVAGPEVDVVALIPAGADPHDYEVRPGDVEALAAADLVVRSGGEVDEWAGEAIEAAGGDAPVLDLLGRMRAIDGDPHWWQDPRNAMRAAEAIAAELGTGASGYLRRLRDLDAAIEACWARVPEEHRKLVTTHDSLSYYAERYGLEVVGAVIPATTTQGQASAGDVDALVQTIREQDVPAVFAESEVDARVERAIAEESGARLGPALHTDSLSRTGPAATYLGALAENTRALVGALTRGEVECSLPG